MNPEDVAKLFPEMPPAALDELAADVGEHGLREPILRWRGEVVDGRHRKWACESAGRDARYIDLRDDMEIADVVARVVSANLHRRHLTDSQRVDLAEQLEDLGLSRSAAASAANVSRDALYKRESRRAEQQAGVDMSTPVGEDLDDPTAQGAAAWDEEHTDEVPHTTIVAGAGGEDLDEPHPETSKPTRDPLDRYYTPEEVARACVLALPDVDSPYSYVRVLEPSVGGGAFVRACRARWGEDTHVVGVDVDPDAEGWGDVNTPLDGCLLEVALPEPDVIDVVVGNPPFRHAEAHATRLLEQGYAVVALLLRVGFLGSAKRQEFWTRFPVTELHVLSARPSFIGQGTDMTDYALFVWRDHQLTGQQQRIDWIDWTT